MKRFHMVEIPVESDAVAKLQHVRVDGGMYLVVLASGGAKNICNVRRPGRHIWRAETSHGRRWAEWRAREGWTISKEEPK